MSKIIKKSNLGIPSPILPAIVLFLFLDKINAREWVMGAFAFFFVIWLIVWVVSLFNRKEVDIIEEIEKLKKK